MSSQIPETETNVLVRFGMSVLVRQGTALRKVSAPHMPGPRGQQSMSRQKALLSLNLHSDE